MQQFKGIQHFSEIEDKFKNTDSLSSTFLRLLKGFRLAGISKELGLTKSKGYDSKDLFQVLFLLPFIGILNIRSLCFSGYSSELSAKKDAFYEFMNNPKINWRKIVHQFSKQFIRIVKQKSINGDQENLLPKCLIVDDSTLEKTGRKIELIGKVFDHCSNTYKLGMKLLTVGFWDGKSFLPLDFSIHNEQGKNQNRGLKSKDLKSQFTKKRAQETPGAIRISELSKSKIEMAVSMIKSAIKIGFAPKYVLADSWFITDDFIKQVGGLKSKTEGQCHVIGLMKANRIVVFNGRNVKAELLPVMKHKKVQKNRKFKCCYIALNVDYKGSELKIFFVKMKGQTSWKMLITTDKTLSFSKAMKYYQIRWSIEVFFKDAKQNLYLGKCQSNDFDAHIASISICFMNYTLLALSKRFESYETLGQMFREIKDQLLEDTLIIKLWNFFIEVFTNLLADLGVDWETFMEKFIQTDDLNEKLKNIFNFLFITNRKDNILAA
ncbi:MAG: transposase [Bacteroidetes bacterium]|nr:transposase [Bacteroidota bacterium]